jgi:hypothetical protein
MARAVPVNDRFIDGQQRQLLIPCGQGTSTISPIPVDERTWTTADNQSPPGG